MNDTGALVDMRFLTTGFLGVYTLFRNSFPSYPDWPFFSVTVFIYSN